MTEPRGSIPQRGLAYPLTSGGTQSWRSHLGVRVQIPGAHSHKGGISAPRLHSRTQPSPTSSPGQFCWDRWQREPWGIPITLGPSPAPSSHRSLRASQPLAPRTTTSRVETPGAQPTPEVDPCSGGRAIHAGSWDRTELGLRPASRANPPGTRGLLFADWPSGKASTSSPPKLTNWEWTRAGRSPHVPPLLLVRMVNSPHLGEPRNPPSTALIALLPSAPLGASQGQPLGAHACCPQLMRPLVRCPFKEPLTRESWRLFICRWEQLYLLALPVWGDPPGKRLL